MTADDFLIGDAVAKSWDARDVVMTIYDFEHKRTIACCNWVVGTRMFKDKVHVDDLVKLDRAKLRKR